MNSLCDKVYLKLCWISQMYNSNISLWSSHKKNLNSDLHESKKEWIRHLATTKSLKKNNKKKTHSDNNNNNTNNKVIHNNWTVKTGSQLK